MKLPKYLRRALERETRKDIFNKAVSLGFTAWEDGEQIEMLDGTVYEVQKDGSWRRITIRASRGRGITRRRRKHGVPTDTSLTDTLPQVDRVLQARVTPRSSNRGINKG